MLAAKTSNIKQKCALIFGIYVFVALSRYYNIKSVAKYLCKLLQESRKM